MPAARVERLALELPRILVFVIFIVVVRPGQANDLELQAQQHSDRRFDRAHLERAQRHEHQHIDKLKLLHLAGRVWVDQHLNVQRPGFQRQLSARTC
jgi:hypothetical protein